MEQAVHALNDGLFLDKASGNIATYKYIEKVLGIGHVSSISFASLCCFTGFGRSDWAFQTAKQSLVNTKTTCNYMSSLISAIEIKADDGSPPTEMTYYFSLWKAIGKSIGQHISTIENSVCAIFRKTKRYDAFVQYQDLYTLDYPKNRVLVKEYGTKDWKEMQFGT